MQVVPENAKQSYYSEYKNETVVQASDREQPIEDIRASLGHVEWDYRLKLKIILKHRANRFVQHFSAKFFYTACPKFDAHKWDTKSVKLEKSCPLSILLFFKKNPMAYSIFTKNKNSRFSLRRNMSVTRKDRNERQKEGFREFAREYEKMLKIFFCFWLLL